jgi:acyl-CoA thioester hydrolase
LVNQNFFPSHTTRERLFECTVYYEDTDCMGVVYHANYLRFLERARSAYVSNRLGTSIVEYHQRGCLFMVQKIEIAYHSPARLGDLLTIRTWIDKTTSFRIVVKQIIIRKGLPKDYLVTANVTLVAVGGDGQLMEIPDEFHGI